jgi:hypothetical protein
MNPNLDDEFRDPDISALLGRVGGDAPATGQAYQQVIGRVRTIRRRRTIATAVGASVCVLAVGALVLQNSSRQTDRVALEPGSAVLTTPDGAKVTTPDGVVVTVITQPDDAPTTTTNSDVVVTPTVTNPSNTGTTNPSVPGGASTTTPTNNTSPSGTNRPTGENDPTTTVPSAPTTTKAPVVAPTTKAPVVAPTTKAPVVAPTTTKAPVVAPTNPPSAPTTTRPPSIPSTSMPRPTVPVVPTIPPLPPSITMACGAGGIKIDIANDSFVITSVRTVLVPGFDATIKKARDNRIEVEFSRTKGRVVASLKVWITGKEIKNTCEIEVEDNSTEDAANDSAGDNNGERADD